MVCGCFVLWKQVWRAQSGDSCSEVLFHDVVQNPVLILRQDFLILLIISNWRPEKRNKCFLIGLQDLEKICSRVACPNRVCVTSKLAIK